MSSSNERYRYFKLMTGEDVIAELVDQTDTHFIVINPMKILVDSDLDRGKQTIFMYNWIPHGVISDKNIRIKKEVLCIEASVDIEILEYYVNIVTDMENDIEKKVEEKKKEEVKYADENNKVVIISNKFKSNKTIE